MHNAIKRILDKRDKEALASQYDVAVCINSVEAARQGFEAVPIQGTAKQYAQDVLDILSELREEFYDSDGEYTSKGMIGDVYFDVSAYIETQIPDPFAHIDKKEVRKVLIQEMAELSNNLTAPVSVLVETSIKFEATGSSGAQYFLAVTFEATSMREFTMIGNIYENDEYGSSIMEEKLFLIDNEIDDEAQNENKIPIDDVIRRDPDKS